MILAVTGGKGGVGKSTLAFELGAATSAVVVDADVGMADLPAAAGPGPDLHDVLAGRASAVEAVREGGAVTLLPCGRSLAGARAADVGRLGEALRDVERAYGDVVVDCPAGMKADAGVPLAVVDACVVVASPQPYALADAVRTRELARELDAGLVAVAVNRAVDDPPEAVFEEVLGAPAVTVPSDPRVARAVETGRPVCRVAPSSRAGRAVLSLARAVDRCSND
ncbi:chromosome partitioning protein ParA [Halogeometricum sp. S1BR25-6]|uniref:Chromosome partitioning protein ParA n=1 Tax=Halogeometricum salsisoli TaxID=2950536 RepID=A0ABU2G9J4_9EURY|nr:chromosome partitioning protein ParA [Halogeometricum sp. S1BR25-6]MDS0297470.1 chromosome partitioning protein ParA [Halogeometricum sp. S1BR25-6]